MVDLGDAPVAGSGLDAGIAGGDDAEARLQLLGGVQTVYATNRAFASTKKTKKLFSNSSFEQHVAPLTLRNEIHFNCRIDIDNCL